MTSTRISLQQFLVQARSSFVRGLEKPEWRTDLTIVVGNESADLDSLCSALLTAYLSSTTPPLAPSTTYHSEPTPPTIPGKLYTPLANLHCADLRLRPELLALLPHVGVDVSTLITLDDLPPEEEWSVKTPPKATRILLVDHNALQGPLKKAYLDSVVGCIDHHDDEKVVPVDTSPEPRIITKAGSCASLVTNYFAEGWDRLSAHKAATPMPVDPEHSSVVAPGGELYFGLEGDHGALYDAQLAKLALAAILIDTTNLTSKEKTTDHDRKAVAYLKAKITTAESGTEEEKVRWDRTKFYEEIKAAKEDIQDLTVEECLRKDYKEWTEDTSAGGKMKLGVASVVKPLSWIIEKSGREFDARSQAEEKFYEALKAYAKKRELDIVAVMTTSTKEGQFQRELLVWAFGSKAVEAAKRFEEQGKAELKLVEREAEGLKASDVDEKDEWRKAWQQKNLGKSRKQVGPLLRKHIQGQHVDHENVG